MSDKCDMLGCRQPATGRAPKFGRGDVVPLCHRHGGGPAPERGEQGLAAALAGLVEFTVAVHADDVAAVSGLGKEAAAQSLRLAVRRGLAAAGPDRGWYKRTGEKCASR